LGLKKYRLVALIFVEIHKSTRMSRKIIHEPITSINLLRYE
jgi:hypothetical protein